MNPENPEPEWLDVDTAANRHTAQLCLRDAIFQWLSNQEIVCGEASRAASLIAAGIARGMDS
jgi:hypothetical protein